MNPGGLAKEARDWDFFVPDQLKDADARVLVSLTQVHLVS